MRRRRELHDRVCRASRALALDRGYEHYTMDDLAEAVDVSRRTLFNHFPSKEDTIFGVDEPEDCPEDELLVERFLQGLPTGRLITDLIDLVATVVRRGDPQASDVLDIIRVLHGNPSLQMAYHRRLEQLVQRLSEPVAQRLGTEPDDPRCRLAVQVMRGLVVEAAHTYADSDGSTPLADILTDYAGLIRTLD